MLLFLGGISIDSTSFSNLAEFFPRVAFGNTVQIIGLKNLGIGQGSCIGDDVWLNIAWRDEKLRMKIGKCVLVGRQSVISTGGYLELGDYCLLAPRVYISDVDHLFADINHPIVEQGITINRKVIIEENCWLGINTVVTGNLTVSRCSVIAANSVVKKDVPPFSVVAGNPGKIIKMFNPQTKEWQRIKNEIEYQEMCKIRNDYPLPTREEYQKILQINAKIKSIDPIVAGGGISI